MKSNLVHTYITGMKFKNIYDGESDDYSRSITHIQYMSPMMTQRWPWIKDKWLLSDGKFDYGYFDTLEEAQKEALSLWPGCGFKTREEFGVE